jgi:hypothetical protein
MIAAGRYCFPAAARIGAIGVRHAGAHSRRHDAFRLKGTKGATTTTILIQRY